ncbi:S-layer homology domain-containing protein [Paenibacillus sp. YIM B09110]|uniref:S-layer homology domain-containing protein n=1 Tax=Paenibacillus sp. YIM B09110 TaxID=3126102 RepID=UPI00301E44A9
MTKKIVRLLMAVLLCLNSAICFADSATAATKTSADFTDLKDLDAATKAKFDSLISAGIFEGVAEGKFGLKEEMNRAQFAKVAALIFGLKADDSLPTSSFNDVKADHWAIDYIEAVKKAGITDGVGNDNFNPAGQVTKEQLATFLVRGLGKDEDAKAEPGVKDSTVSDWASGYVALALDLKLLDNGADGKFGGQANATRDLLLTGAYEAKAQYVSPGKVSILEAKQVGMKKINVTFNKPVDSTKAGLSIANAEGAQVKWAADNKSATLTFAKNLEEASYVITLTGLNAAEVGNTTATVTATAETVTKIEFTSASDTVVALKPAVIPFKATNQFGEAVDDFSKFEVQATVPAYIDINRMAVIADPWSRIQGDRISITVIHVPSGVTATKIVTVGASEVVPPVVTPPSVVATPTVSLPSGAVPVGTSVSLINATQGATIYYTTDGTTPSTSSTVYSSPITITNAMTIKAIAVKAGWTSSSVARYEYTVTLPIELPESVQSDSLLIVGQAYTGSVAKLSGGTGAVSYAVTNGTLPAGLTLNPSTGAITGTPSESGTYSFTIRATDSATTPATASMQYTVTITPLVPTLTLLTSNPANVMLTEVGATASLVITAGFDDDTSINVTAEAQYESNDTRIATVSNSGVVTAVANGTTNIVVTYDGITKNVPVMVIAARQLESISASLSSVSLAVGMIANVTVTAFFDDDLAEGATAWATFEIEDPDLATIDANGYLTALKPGRTKIKVTFLSEEFITDELIIWE